LYAGRPDRLNPAGAGGRPGAALAILVVMVHIVLSAFRVRSYETDPYAHLNNGVYLSWFEQGRLDWLQSLGFSYAAFAERRQWLVVARTEVDFRAPLRIDDRVALTTRVEEVGRSSLRFRQVMRRLPPTSRPGSDLPDILDAEPEGEVAAEALTVMVFTADGRAVPVPLDVRNAVEPRLATQSG